MHNVIIWLIELEELAGDLYRGAAPQFRDDKMFHDFLEDLARDEAWHFHIMGSAAELVRKNEDIKTLITFDSTTKEKIEAPLRRNYEMLSFGTLTKESLLEGITETEYSEWNHIFLYVVNTLKLRSKEFMYAVSKMQDHIELIEQFLVLTPEGRKYIEKIKGIPDVRGRKILIVDGFSPLVEILKQLLKKEGSIETAANGMEGHEKIKNTYFDVIISDIDMPLMNGIAFYEAAVKHDPDIRNRFIFFTGSNDEKAMDFIRGNNIRYMEKPLGIPELQTTVREILHGIETQL